MNKKLKTGIVFAGFILLWQILTMTGIWNTYILPTPLHVLFVAKEMFLDGSLFVDLLISVKRVCIGFSISFLLASFFAMVFHLFPQLNDYFNGVIQFMKNVPPLSLVPLLILWLGIGEVTKIAMIVLASFFPLFLNIQKGFMIVDPQLLEVGEVFGYSKSQRFFKITIPSALKDIFIGIRVALGYSWRSIIAAEMIAASSGLGYMINFARQMSRTDRVIVGIFVIGMVGWFTDYLFVKIATRCLKGDLRNEWYNS